MVGHKDLDLQPAWVSERCPDADCPVYVDPDGRGYRRRVDPPEGLFAALASQALPVPRGQAGGDAELLRAEAIPGGQRARDVVARRKAVTTAIPKETTWLQQHL